mmetsp:Transcript_72624/g.117089  ORF Transcript_72624/g.117089 Transcript_72624/m.117089 type:complete len:413 (+) Transcript_72624:107-1345(+)
MSWGGNGGGSWNQGGGSAAPVVRNPFAAAPAAAVGPAGGVLVGGPVRGLPDEAATGPTLGYGSELQRVYNMPVNMGHNGCVSCMVMADGKVYSGGRDENLFVWQAQGSAGAGFQLIQDCAPIHLGSSVTALLYEPSSKWLFCGLWSGEIRAFCKDPVREDRLQGHRRSVACLLVHSSVVISGSNDGTVRLWTFDPAAGRFQCHGQPLNNPSGPVNCMRVLGEALWVGGNTGITCFDLASLQPKGTLPAEHPVTGLIECSGYMAATFRDGSVKIYDPAGSPIFQRPPMGEHTSNTAVELMMHPLTNKAMLLCGQQLGYVTAYDLPEFKPRGSFCCKDRSDIKVILDTKNAGMFLTAGFHGDIMVWQWGAPGPGGVAGGQAGAPVAASPFAPAGQGVAASPFGGAAQQVGGMMM